MYFSRRRRTSRSWDSAGWTDDLRDSWPWHDDDANQGTVSVRFAKRNAVRGRPVTVAEIIWTGDGLGGAATTYNGRGTVVIVGLPHALPDAAIQRRRRPDRSKRDAFDRRFRIIVADASLGPALTSTALRTAHVGGRIPTWSIHASEIYALVHEHRIYPADRYGTKSPPRVRPLSVQRSIRQVDRVLDVIDMLGIGGQTL